MLYHVFVFIKFESNITAGGMLGNMPLIMGYLSQYNACPYILTNVENRDVIDDISWFFFYAYN